MDSPYRLLCLNPTIAVKQTDGMRLYIFEIGDITVFFVPEYAITVVDRYADDNSE